MVAGLLFVMFLVPRILAVPALQRNYRWRARGPHAMHTEHLVNLSTEDYLRELCQKQERTNELLKYLCVVISLIALLLVGARWGWWPL